MPGPCPKADFNLRALAVAARHPDRVRRCTTVVSLGPYGVPGLDFFAGMSAEYRQEWAWIQQGEQALVEHMVPDLVSWIDTLDTEQPPEGMTQRSRCIWSRPALLFVNGQVVVSGFGQLKVPAPRVSSAGFPGGSSLGSGLFHPVGVAVGDYDVAVVEQPVEHADGGGVLGQEPAPGLERPV